MAEAGRNFELCTDVAPFKKSGEEILEKNNLSCEGKSVNRINFYVELTSTIYAVCGLRTE